MASFPRCLRYKLFYCKANVTVAYNKQGIEFQKFKLNLSWNDLLNFRKQKATYTTASGVLKHLSVLLYKLLKNEKDTSNSFFVSNDVVEVYPVVFSNDGTALKLNTIWQW